MCNKIENTKVEEVYKNINYIIELFHFKQHNSNNLVYIETIIKRLFKTECNFANVKSKLQHPEFDEKQDNMSLNKFIKWLLNNIHKIQVMKSLAYFTYNLF